MGYPKMEKLPKGATASDMSGQKKVSVPKEDKEVYKSGASGEKMPKGVLASDESGEKRRSMMGGVGMGMADGIGERDKSHMGKTDGRLGEMKGGSREHDCYSHERSEYK
jgi:hypothetical protein